MFNFFCVSALLNPYVCTTKQTLHEILKPAACSALHIGHKTNDEIELLMTEFNTFIDTFITDTWDDSAIVEAKKFLDSGVYFLFFKK